MEVINKAIGIFNVASACIWLIAFAVSMFGTSFKRAAFIATAYTVLMYFFPWPTIGGTALFGAIRFWGVFDDKDDCLFGIPLWDIIMDRHKDSFPTSITAANTQVHKLSQDKYKIAFMDGKVSYLIGREEVRIPGTGDIVPTFYYQKLDRTGRPSSNKVYGNDDVKALAKQLYSEVNSKR